jgi:hypothetical protein
MAVIFAAVMLVIVGVAKIVSIGGEGKTAAQYVMTFYFIVISIVMVAVEFGQGQAQQWFLFLNFGWGKVFLYCYLICAILSMPSLALLEYFIAIALFIACLFNIYIDRKYKDEEMARIKDAIEAIQLRALREKDRSGAYAA